MARAEPFGVVKLKGILFGDDNWGTVLDEEAPYKNKHGIEMKRFLIIPGEHLIKQYPELQRPGALTYRGKALWVEYPVDWVDDWNPSRTNAIVRVDCGFDGRGSRYADRYKRLTDEIRMLREELEIVKISNMDLNEEIRTILTEKKAMMKEYVEMVDLMRGERRGAPTGELQENYPPSSGP